MTMGGFAGNVLYIDLTHGEIKHEPLDMALAEKYIGGLGLTVKLAYDTIKPGNDALLYPRITLSFWGPDLWWERTFRAPQGFLPFRNSPQAGP
jgi:hypothetical protein